jgi:hypothetical protein
MRLSKSDWLAIALTPVGAVLGQILVGPWGILGGALLGAIAFGFARFNDDGETVSLFRGLPPASPSVVTRTPPPIAAPVPPVVDKTHWPDVLLQCDWPQLFGKPGEHPFVPGISGHIVRNRPWSLRHPGGGIIYNVKIQDINFGGYVVVFERVPSLTDTPVEVTPVIFKTSPTEVVIVHDLESLMAHPPDGCNTDQYERPSGGDRLTADVPVRVEYSDKNGKRFRVDYKLHYDFWLEEGKMIRLGGIEELT